MFAFFYGFPAFSRPTVWLGQVLRLSLMTMGFGATRRQGGRFIHRGLGLWRSLSMVSAPRATIHQPGSIRKMGRQGNWKPKKIHSG